MWARVLTSRPVLLALSAAVGLVLSAVQVLPSTEFTRLSDRAPGRIGDRLLGRVEAGTHTEYTYDFSVGPWRLAEYVWPNFSGRQFPVHRRWLEVIPAEARIWTPSLYMGLLPMLLALSAMRFHRREPRRSPPRGSEPRDCWLSWAVVLAVVASFGWYGLGWLAHEINYAAGGDPAGLGLVGDPFGGLYWLMTVALPGYAYFRYPAKLLVVAAMGLSVLAARGFDCVLANPSDRFRRGVLWLGGLSLCGALVALAIRPFWHGWLGGVEADPLFGPLDTSGAASDLLGAFVQTAVLCGLFWWLLRPARSGVRWVPVVALLLSAADLAVANAHLVVTAPADQWQRPSKFAAVLKREEAEGDGQPYRVVRHPIWTPPAFRSTRSPDRLSEAMRWDLDTLWPKYNLADRIPVLGVRGALAPCDFEAFWSLGDWNQTPDALRLPFSLAKYVILPGGKVLTAGGPTDARRPPEGDFRIPDGDGTVLAARESGQSPTRLSASPQVEDASLWRNPRPLPRAWIVHQVDWLPPLASSDPAEVRRRTELVRYHSDGRPRDLRCSALVESSGQAYPAQGALADSPRQDGSTQALAPYPETCRLVHYDPLRVEIDAELARPGLVVLADQFYPGWTLQIETPGQPSQPAPILRTNRVMRGAWLPAGRHWLIYRYRPTSFAWGAILSGLAWIGVLACGGGSVLCAAKGGLAGWLGRRSR